MNLVFQLLAKNEASKVGTQSKFYGVIQWETLRLDVAKPLSIAKGFKMF